MEKNIAAEYMDGLIETAIGADPSAMYYLLSKMEKYNTINDREKKSASLSSQVAERYLDDLVETAIGFEPEAMQQVIKRMETISLNLKERKEPDRMEKTFAKTFNELFMDDLVETAIGVDPEAMFQMLKRMEPIPQSVSGSKKIERREKTFNELYMDDLVETAIGVDPEAMYQVLKRMESIPQSMSGSKKIDRREKTFNELYMDDLVETAIGVDPEAMYQVLKRMEFIPQSVSGSKKLDPREKSGTTTLPKSFAEVYMDDLVDTAIGIDPAAMVQVLNRMESRQDIERDRSFSTYVDELTDGIDQELKELFDQQNPGWHLSEDADLKLKSAEEINSKTIYDLLNRIEERLNKTERNLAELKAVI